MIQRTALHCQFGRNWFGVYICINFDWVFVYKINQLEPDYKIILLDILPTIQYIRFN